MRAKTQLIILLSVGSLIQPILSAQTVLVPTLVDYQAAKLGVYVVNEKWWNGTLSFSLSESSIASYRKRDETPNRLFKIDEIAFIRELNRQLGDAKKSSISLVEVRTKRSDLSEKMGKEWPIFDVELTVQDTAGKIITGNGHAGGTAYSAWSRLSRENNPEAVSSASYAYWMALIIAAVDVDRQISQAMPNQSPEPALSSVTPPAVQESRPR